MHARAQQSIADLASFVLNGGMHPHGAGSDPVFIDCGSTVTLDLPLPEGTPAGDVFVSGGADSLVVRVGDDPAVPPLFSVIQLYSTVSPDDTRTESPVEGRLRITLQKLEPNLRWPSLGVQDEPQVYFPLPLIKPCAASPHKQQQTITGCVSPSQRVLLTRWSYRSCKSESCTLMPRAPWLSLRPAVWHFSSSMS